MKYLLICTLGPVQEFIATARRSRDLWFGSWMLSELSKSAAAKITELYGKDSLVFPFPEKTQLLEPNSEFNVANKIVAIIETEPKIQEIKDAIKVRLSEIKDGAFGKVTEPYDDSLAARQVEDLLEFYWVIVEFENENSYPQARDTVEAFLAARKNTRNFKQLIGENVPKSSLDGERESVIPETAFPSGRDKEAARDKKIRDLYNRYGARQGERLSGVDIIKRLGTSKSLPKFKSTSHMAALPFLEMISRTKGKEQKQALLNDIKNLLQQSEWDIGEQDGALVYESRLLEWVPAGPQQDELRRQLSELLKKYAGNTRPDAYYALLLADGDNMGIAIDAQKDPAAHRELSGALSAYAIEASNIIEKHDGVPIYAGGDDIMAYLPLHTVLDCAVSLANEFKDKMQSFKVSNGNGQTISPTLSAGIVVAHHLTPLSDVMELARETEKKAKQMPGKEAIAIMVSKRSGADRTIQGKWGEIDERLNKLIEFARMDSVSTGTAYELQKLHRDLSQTDIPEDGIIAETIRIIGRKRESGGGKDISEDVKKLFEKWLKQEKISIEELAHQMIIAQTFASAFDLVKKPLSNNKEVQT